MVVCRKGAGVGVWFVDGWNTGAGLVLSRWMMALSNIATNSCRAANYNGTVVKGDRGDGVSNTWVSAMAASISASAGDVDGIVSLREEKSTVLATRSLLVFVMYIMWHL